MQSAVYPVSLRIVLELDYSTHLLATTFLGEVLY